MMWRPARGMALLHPMEWGSIALVVAMVAAAEYFQAKDIIFPEIAALAFGAWVMPDRPWPGPAWTIWFSPTLGAVTGVLVLAWLPYPLAALVGIAFAIVLVELRLCRSAMSPSLSAAILPIITNIHGWIYPACVCLMTAAIAWLASHNEQRLERKPAPVTATTKTADPWPSRYGRALRYHGKLIVFVLLAALLAVRLDLLYIISPPLLVAFVELAEPEGALRGKSGLRLLLLLTGAAVCGSAWVLVLVQHFSGPLWLAAGGALAMAFGLARVCRLASPPAFALALLPMILPLEAVFWYPLEVGIGSLLFLVISRLWFKTVEEREPKAGRSC